MSNSDPKKAPAPPFFTHSGGGKTFIARYYLGMIKLLSEIPEVGKVPKHVGDAMFASLYARL